MTHDEILAEKCVETVNTPKVRQRGHPEAQTCGIVVNQCLWQNGEGDGNLGGRYPRRDNGIVKGLVTRTYKKYAMVALVAPALALGPTPRLSQAPTPSWTSTLTPPQMGLREWQ